MKSLAKITGHNRWTPCLFCTCSRTFWSSFTYTLQIIFYRSILILFRCSAEQRVRHQQRGVWSSRSSCKGHYLKKNSIKTKDTDIIIEGMLFTAVNFWKCNFPVNHNVCLSVFSKINVFGCNISILETSPCLLIFFP